MSLFNVPGTDPTPIVDPFAADVFALDQGVPAPAAAVATPSALDAPLADVARQALAWGWSQLALVASQASPWLTSPAGRSTLTTVALLLCGACVVRTVASLAGVVTTLAAIAVAVGLAFRLARGGA